jgi:hypothetical protein
MNTRPKQSDDHRTALGTDSGADSADSGDSAFYCGAARLRATLARNAGYVECTVTEMCLAT